MKKDLSCYLFVDEQERRPLKALGIDVSGDGLGIVCFEELSAKTKIVLILNEKKIPLNVVWCKPDPVRTGIFHLGLVVTQPHHNLLDLFVEAQLLDANAPSAEQNLLNIDIEIIRNWLTTIQIVDALSLSDLGFGHLAATHRAFPIICSHATILIVAPKNISVIDLMSLDEVTASKKIVVFRQVGKRWVKTWP